MFLFLERANLASLGVLLAAAFWTPLGRLAPQEPQDTVHLDPVVVTATRLPVPRSSLPLAVTVLDGDDLRARGIRQVALRLVPSLAVVQTGSFGGAVSIFLRGGEANYVKVLVDGVAINQPGSVDLAHLTLDNVERIETVRGPASVLYGSDGVVGVVQIFTRRGGSPRANLAVRAGTFATAAAEASLSAGNDAVRYGFGFSRSTTDGILAFNNGYDNTAWSGSVRAAPDAVAATPETGPDHRSGVPGAGSPDAGSEHPARERSR
jgi:vitamin B12 transporter